jgi:hypothetical protein
MDQLVDVEEWQIRQLAKKRATQMDQISSIVQDKLDEYQSTAESAAERHSVPIHECIPASDVGAGVDDPELQQRILRAAASASCAQRVPVVGVPEES